MVGSTAKKDIKKKREKRAIRGATHQTTNFDRRFKRFSILRTSGERSRIVSMRRARDDIASRGEMLEREEGSHQTKDLDWGRVPEKMRSENRNLNASTKKTS